MVKLNEDLVVRLLATTQMTMQQIAYRVGCSERTVSRVNGKNRVREYPMSRSRGERWTVVATGEEVEL